MDGCGKVLNVRDGIAVRLRDGVKCPIVSTKAWQSPGVFLGTMCRGEAQEPEED